MIIFDLDGTLADCTHRRHFVDPVSAGYSIWIDNSSGKADYGIKLEDGSWKKWKPDWKSFYEACDQDLPIIYTQSILRALWAINDYTTIEIWSGRCESVQRKTEEWLQKHGLLKAHLKMRPIGDYTPDDKLKERWLDESIADGKQIQFVFDDRKKVVEMWRRRGIFVFDVSQGKGDF